MTCWYHRLPEFFSKAEDHTPWMSKAYRGVRCHLDPPLYAWRSHVINVLLLTCFLHKLKKNVWG